MIDWITSISLWELTKHSLTWLSNLKRAHTKRKRDSIEALRRVVKASRSTAVYIRQIQEAGKSSHTREQELSILWTDLAFALEDLKILKLAEKCHLKGIQWSDSSRMKREDLKKSDIGLIKLEKMALDLLEELD